MCLESEEFTMNFIQYIKQAWKAGTSGGTPLSPDRLNHMEDGIKNNNDMISELNNNLSEVSYVSNLIRNDINAWCEIATYSYNNQWNTSKFIIIGADSIYLVEYGYDLYNKTYLNRCNAAKVFGHDKIIGFKAINNVLHIYIKQDNNFSSIACLGLHTENYPLIQFNYKVTDLTDNDMDKIV